MKTKRVKLSSLVLDYSIYPRGESEEDLERDNIRRMLDRLEAGGDLPPIVIDKKSKRVTDGFHRTTAQGRHLGEDGQVEVIEKTYASLGDMLIDAAALNAANALPFSSHDRMRMLQLAAEFKIERGRIAEALGITIERLEAAEVKRTSADGTILKRTIRHKAGQPLSDRQKQANKRLSGMQPVFYVDQLLELLQADLIDRENEAVMQALRKLAGELEKFLLVTV